MSSVALLKHMLMRWRRFIRLLSLSKGELAEASKKADDLYLAILFRRWRLHLDALQKQTADVDKAVRGALRKRQLQASMDAWYLQYSVIALGQRSLLRRMFSTLKTVWTVRKAALAFWYAATQHDELKLVRRVFMGWGKYAHHQARIARERKAVRIMLKHSSSSSLFNAFSVWQAQFNVFKRNRRHNRKALAHYFSRLSQHFFAEWKDFVSRAKTMGRILPLFANISQRGKFFFAWRKWREHTVHSKRNSNLHFGVEQTAIAFMKRMMSSHLNTYFR